MKFRTQGQVPRPYLRPYWLVANVITHIIGEGAAA